MSAHRQNYTPPHQRAHPFAPGVVEHHIHSRAHQRRALMRWLRRVGLLIGATAWLLLVFTAVASSAHAQTTPAAIGLHLGSHHFSAAPAGHRGWNDSNPGVYARWSNGLTVGTLYNSERRQSAYAAYMLESSRWHGLSASVMAGAITGYTKPIKPLASASVALDLSSRATLRLSYLPRSHPKSSAVVHLSVEWRL